MYKLQQLNDEIKIVIKNNVNSSVLLIRHKVTICLTNEHWYIDIKHAKISVRIIDKN